MHPAFVRPLSTGMLCEAFGVVDRCTVVQQKSSRRLVSAVTATLPRGEHIVAINYPLVL